MGLNDNNRFSCFLPRTLQVGDQIILKGRLQTDPEYFSLNLVKDAQNVALHYKIMYKERRTVLNTMIGEEWGAEEKYPHVVVEPGSIFTVKFAMQSDRIVVYFNDKYDVEYKHRSIPISEIKELQFWWGLNEIISTEHIYANN